MELGCDFWVRTKLAQHDTCQFFVLLQGAQVAESKRYQGRSGIGSNEGISHASKLNEDVPFAEHTCQERLLGRKIIEDQAARHLSLLGNSFGGGGIEAMSSKQRLRSVKNARASLFRTFIPLFALDH